MKTFTLKYFIAIVNNLQFFNVFEADENEQYSTEKYSEEYSIDDLFVSPIEIMLRLENFFEEMIEIVVDRKEKV